MKKMLLVSVLSLVLFLSSCGLKANNEPQIEESVEQSDFEIGADSILADYAASNHKGIPVIHDRSDLDKMYNQASTESEETEIEEKPIKKFENFEATETILNAQFAEKMVQIDDIVVQYFDGMTLHDFMLQFPDHYTISYMSGKEIKEDDLVDANDTVYIYNTNFVPLDYLSDAEYDDAKRCYALSIFIRNNTNRIATKGECTIERIKLNQVYEGSIYLAKGIPYTEEQLLADDNYSFENLETQLERLTDAMSVDGFDIYQDREKVYYLPGKTYRIIWFTSVDGYDYKNFIYFNIDLDTKHAEIDYDSFCYFFGTWG